MSAWDIAGAVVWTVLAVICAAWWQQAERSPTVKAGDGTCLALCVGTILFGFSAVFCIARLFGAHA